MLPRIHHNARMTHQAPNITNEMPCGGLGGFFQLLDAFILPIYNCYEGHVDSDFSASLFICCESMMIFLVQV